MKYYNIKLNQILVLNWEIYHFLNYYVSHIKRNSFINHLLEFFTQKNVYWNLIEQGNSSVYL